MSSINILKTANKAAEDKQASQLVVLDLRGHSDLCDFQLLCSAENEKQSQAIAENIEIHCRNELKAAPLSIEGRASGHWIAMDYGSVIIHIFHKKLRDYYAIESLWPTANVDVNSLQ